MTNEARPVLSAWLAFVAGSVDAVGFAVAGHDTSHMSGTTTETMHRLVHGESSLALLGIEALASFAIGAAACGFFVARRPDRQVRTTIAALLAVEAVWVAIGGLVLALSDGMMAEHSGIACLAFAMGQQNATSSELIGDQTRTTHVTGIITDIGRRLGALTSESVGRRDPAGVRDLMRSCSLFAGFVLGAAIGAAATVMLGSLAVLAVAPLPAAAAAACALDRSRGAPS